MLLEAKPLNVDYQTLTFFANELAKQTKIKEIKKKKKTLSKIISIKRNLKESVLFTYYENLQAPSSPLQEDQLTFYRENKYLRAIERFNL